MLEKIKKYNNKKLIIVAICIIVVMGFFYVYNHSKKLESNNEIPLDYNEVISNGTDKKNVYVSVEFNDIPYLIAEQKVNYSYIKYYILYDKNDYMYVSKLSDSTYNKIKEKYDKFESDFSYSLTGYIYETPNDLKKIIINSFNKSSDIKLTNDNYANYFGSTYLDDSYTKYTAQLAISLIIIIVSIVIAIIVLINWFIFKINTKKTLSKIDKELIESELLKDSTKEYKKAKIFITDKYLISTHKGLHVFDYNDSMWIYVANGDFKFISADKVYLNILTKNKKRYKSKSLDNHKKQIFDEIIEEIGNKNSNILLGYTYENMEKYNK